MDPLRISDLKLTANWNTFTPDMKGFMPPQKLKLWHPDFNGIESQIRHFASPLHMRDNNAPFFALAVQRPFRTTALSIRGENFTFPITPREIKFLDTHLGNPDVPRQTAAGNEVGVLNAVVNATRQSSISESIASVVVKLKAVGDFIQCTTLQTLEVFKAGSHELITTPESDDHFATVFVVLPSLTTNSANIHLHATHETVTTDVQLPTDISQSVSAIGVYTGVSAVYIEVGAGDEFVCITYHISAATSGDPVFVPRLKYLSGALPPLRDAFCLWRHLLNSGANAPALMLFFLEESPRFIDNFVGDDATLLSHLAPLAKAYRFNIYLGQLVHTESTTQEVQHPYKEYFESNEDLDPSVLKMRNNPDEDYQWASLCTLGGATLSLPALLDRATQMVTTDPDLQDQLREIDVDDDYEIEDDSLYFATVVYTYTRTASILFIAP